MWTKERVLEALEKADNRSFLGFLRAFRRIVKTVGVGLNHSDVAQLLATYERGKKRGVLTESELTEAKGMLQKYATNLAYYANALQTLA